jgi:hypothetical protein
LSVTAKKLVLKTDVASPHPTLSYHGGAGRNRRGCTEGAEVKQAQNLNTLMIYDDNRGRDQQDVTEMLDRMF